MLADMNKCGLVDPDIFISQSNELARQLRAAKQEKERLLADGDDDAIPRTRELLETLETLPEFLPAFDSEIFTDLVERFKAEGWPSATACATGRCRRRNRRRSWCG